MGWVALEHYLELSNFTSWLLYPVLASSHHVLCTQNCGTIPYMLVTGRHDSVSHDTKQGNCIHSGRGGLYCILTRTIISGINITPFDVSNFVEFYYGASWSTTEKMKV